MKHLLLCNQVQRPGRNKEEMMKKVGFVKSLAPRYKGKKMTEKKTTERT